jgi:hypothetical protein
LDSLSSLPRWHPAEASSPDRPASLSLWLAAFDARRQDGDAPEDDDTYGHA